MPRDVAGGERGLDRVGQAARLVLDRAPPVETERDHLMRVGQVVDEIVVGHADRPIRLHAAGLARIPFQRLQLVDEAQAQPHALAVDFQMRPQNAGQKDDGRSIGGRAAARAGGRGAGAARILAGPRQRSDRTERLRLLLQQAVRDGAGGALVGEVVEVRDPGAAVEQKAR